MKTLYVGCACLALACMSCRTEYSATTELSASTPYVPYDSLSVLLEEVIASDHSVREKMEQTETPDEQMEVYEEMRAIDSTNQLIVTAMLERYGWLPESKIGTRAADALFYVIEQADAATLELYLPQLQQMALIGEASKIGAAMLEDRLLMYQHKKQIYGTQATNTLLEDGTMAIWPIQDHKHVNKLRKKAGFLTTVEENAIRLQAVYNPEAELPAEDQAEDQ